MGTSCNVLVHPQQELIDALTDYVSACQRGDSTEAVPTDFIGELMSELSLPITPKQYRASFCQILRRAQSFDLHCVHCDVTHGALAYDAQRSLCYQCHVGLIDIVAPLRVGDYHVANIFIGQLLGDASLDIPNILHKYQMTPETRIADAGLHNAYGELRRPSQEWLTNAADFLFAFSNLISRSATARAARRLFGGLGQDIQIGQDSNDLFRKVLANARKLLRFDHASLWLTDGATSSNLKPLYGEWGGESIPGTIYARSHPRDVGIAGQALKSQGVVIYRNSAELQESGLCLDVLKKAPNLRSGAAVPLSTEAGVLGVMEVYSENDNVLWEDTIHVVAEYVARAAIAASIRVEIPQILAQILNPPEQRQTLLAIVAESVPHLVGAVACSIFMRDPTEGDVARCVATTGFSQSSDEHTSSHTCQAGAGLTGRVLAEGAPLRFDSLREAAGECPSGFSGSAIAPELRDRELVLDTRGGQLDVDQFAGLAFLATPILGHSGSRAVGVIRAYGFLPFRQQQQQLLADLGDLLGKHRIENVRLSRLLAASQAIRNERSPGNLAYKLLTLFTHGQGLGVNRAMLFRYARFFGRFEHILSVGPEKRPEADEMFHGASNVPPLEKCLADCEIGLAAVSAEGLNKQFSAIGFFYPTYAPSGESRFKFDSLTNGLEDVLVTEAQPAEVFSGALGEALDRIGMKQAVLCVMPARRRHIYFLLCDNPFTRRSPDSTTIALMPFLFRQFVEALEAVERLDEAKETKFEMFRDAARVAVHTVGQSLPPAINRLERAKGMCREPETARILDEVLNLVSSANSSLLAFSMFYQNVVPNEAKTVSQLLDLIDSELSYVRDRADLRIQRGGPLADVALLVNSRQIVSCFGVLVENSLEHGNCPQAVLTLEARYLESLESSSDDTAGGTSSGPYVCFRFADNGRGVPLEIRQRIFSPLFSTKPRGGGTGLAYVREILHRHGGIVREVGVRPAGACFELCFPVVSQGMIRRPQ
jgi:signal transduction histidine kinase/ligand-binding sensor protein/GAF domain-containing protein